MHPKPKGPSSGLGKEFTIMIIPHCHEEPYAFRLSQRWVQWTGIALIVLLLSSISLVYSLRQTKLQLATYHGLLAENRQQQEHILFLARQTTELQGQLAEIQALDNSIRTMMRLTPASVTAAVALPTDNPGTAREARLSLLNRGTSLAATILRTQQNIEEIKEAIPETEESLQDLERKVELQRRREAATPSLWPTSGDVTSGFGRRRSPFGGSWEHHEGVDIAAPRGTSVFAAANGIVRVAGWNGGYGNVVFIDHGFGMSTVYAHLHRISVRVGQQVTKGQQVGLVGSTGRSTAPHLHYEVRVNGQAVNPLRFLPE
ncbi:MAG: Murein DD-endopeptidase MepM [Firmicutes bacterium]|nr:Murein DD-endopeptidase MepM [candidate division NPL-UPA2 bacterium]